MRLLVLALSAATATACGGPTHEISARGFSTAISNHALSRTTAENRAIAALQELLAPDAVSFSIKKSGSASLFEIQQPKTKAVFERVEFQPLTKGWMAIAFTKRNADAAEAMTAMPVVDASATVTASVLEMAAATAKSRALRQLISETAEGDGTYTGSLTLASVEYEFDTSEPAGSELPGDTEPESNDTEAQPSMDETESADEADAAAETAEGETGEPVVEPEENESADPLHQVTVTVRGLAKTERTGDISAEDRIAVARQAAVEHFRVGEWKDSAETASDLLELTPASLPFILLKAAAHFHMDETGPATESLFLAIMEGGGPEAEAVTNAFAELSKTVGAANITRLTAALEEQKIAAVDAAKKSAKKKKKRKKRKK